MNQEIFKEIISKQIPIAWIAGVRLESASENEIKTKVELDFLNQNPFNSMFWAVEGMAAEFCGGLLLNEKIVKSKHNIATLVIKNEAFFTKKALGKIVFSCDQGSLIDASIQQAIDTKQGVVIELTSIGKDEAGDEVATFKFTWSLKLRS